MDGRGLLRLLLDLGAVRDLPAEGAALDAAHGGDAAVLANIVVFAGSGSGAGWPTSGDGGRRSSIPGIIAIFVTPLYLLTQDPTLDHRRASSCRASSAARSTARTRAISPSASRPRCGRRPSGFVYHQGAIWGGLVAPVLAYFAVRDEHGLRHADDGRHHRVPGHRHHRRAAGPETKGKQLTADLEVIKVAGYYKCWKLGWKQCLLGRGGRPRCSLNSASENAGKAAEKSSGPPKEANSVGQRNIFAATDWLVGLARLRNEHQRTKGVRPMCRGHDQNCPDFRPLLQEAARGTRQRAAELPKERLRGLRRRGGAEVASGSGLVSPAAALAHRRARGSSQPSLCSGDAEGPLHWGYFSKLLKWVVEVNKRRLRHHRRRSTHHANDWDAGAYGQGSNSGPRESVVPCGPRTRRASTGAAPVRSTASRPGAVSGGASASTSAAGPVFIQEVAEPGDILEVRIVERRPRLSGQLILSPARPSGSNAAAWWGFHYKEAFSTEPSCAVRWRSRSP